MNIITILSVVFAIVMIWGNIQSKKKNAEWGKSVSILCGIAVICLTFWNLLGPKKSIGEHARERETAYDSARAMILANYLSNLDPGAKRCLIINDKNRPEKAVIEAIKKGLGSRVSTVIIEPIVPDAGPEFDVEMATADDYNNILKRHEDADIVISLISLPYDEEELYSISLFQTIEDKDNPGTYIRDPEKKFPLFGLYRGRLKTCGLLLEDEFLNATTIISPTPTLDPKYIPTENVKEAFDRRYLLVNPQNLASIDEKLAKKKKKK